MKTIHVILGVKGLPVAQLAVYGQSIATALDKNSNFPNLYPNPDMLKTAIDSLNTAIAHARPGDKLSTASVHAAEAGLYRVLKALAAHVEFESHNNETIALSSGFSLRKTALHVAHAFEVMQGLHSGTVDLKNAYTANSGYVWQLAPDPLEKEGWKTDAITIKASHTITGLKPGSKYWFRVAVVTTKGQQPYSDPIMLLVI